MAYNKRQKLQDNIAAIRTVFQLEKEGRTATDAEREVLKRYSGFGGLKFVLNPVDKDSIQNEKVWKPSDRPFIADTLRLHELLRENSKDDRQYREYVQSLKSSVLTSFYTPQPVIAAIAKVFKDAGFNAIRVPVTWYQHLDGDNNFKMNGTKNILMQPEFNNTDKIRDIISKFEDKDIVDSIKAKMGVQNEHTGNFTPQNNSNFKVIDGLVALSDDNNNIGVWFDEQFCKEDGYELASIVRNELGLH